MGARDQMTAREDLWKMILARIPDGEIGFIDMRILDDLLAWREKGIREAWEASRKGIRFCEGPFEHDYFDIEEWLAEQGEK